MNGHQEADEVVVRSRREVDEVAVRSRWEVDEVVDQGASSHVKTLPKNLIASLSRVGS